MKPYELTVKMMESKRVFRVEVSEKNMKLFYGDCIEHWELTHEVSMYDIGYRVGRILTSDCEVSDVKYLRDGHGNFLRVVLWYGISENFDKGFLVGLDDVRKEDLRRQYIETCVQSLHPLEYQRLSDLAELYWGTGNHAGLDEIADKFENITYEDLANLF